MGDYEVIIFTGNVSNASTFNKIYIKLVGTDGESERTHLWSCVPSFYRGAVSHFIVSCRKSLGHLALIELEKENQTLVPNMAWYPAKVDVTSPEGGKYSFPVYRWITNSKPHYFREGAGLCQFSNAICFLYYNPFPLHLSYFVFVYFICFAFIFFSSWDKQGISHLKADSVLSLPYDIRFSLTKTVEMVYIGEDAFFGYQFLNGTNPILIQRCTQLPNNLSVTDETVFPDGQHNLAEEMEKGNIFLCDYKILDEVESNTINGNKQFLMAPLVLLWKNNADQLMPVAIQLKQKPTKDNPIFYPSDSEYDWLLAKTFVRSANFNLYELNAHLLRTHLLAEVFAVSLLRNLPMVHPLYKLLIPHTRYTLNINFLARMLLISKGGTFAKFTSSGGEGALTILRRSLTSLTYSSLCIPDDIEERGLKDVPNFYYRDDGLQLWEIINRFYYHFSTLAFYYKTDAEVQEDTELQNWIKEIFQYGFLSQETTGEFSTMDEMVKFVTMVIFTCSAQHSAVNSGQYDFGGWMPNSPTTMELPPPKEKGTITEKTILDTFPSVNTTVHAMSTVWLLSKQSSDSIFLGNYPEKHFTERFPLLKIKEFQEELKKLSADIKARNSRLDLPYTYMDPEVVENSVSI
uniref:Arachidonate 15-lipoxygenase B-like n=1 Tax=Pundamilia nyererei TaxID=303518 RepID=A0A3B4GDL0_9CICH